MSLEPLNVKELHEPDGIERFINLEPDDVPDDSPIIEGVVIVERRRVWDGVLSGICEIKGKRYFFNEIVESIWRHYNQQYTKAYDGKKFQRVERLWRIFAVYDCPLKNIPKFKTAAEEVEWMNDRANVIGIFFNYELADSAKSPWQLEQDKKLKKPQSQTNESEG